MIPDKFFITKEIADYFILNNQTKFFEVADEYVVLQQKFIRESLIEKILLWVDLLVSPLLTLYSFITTKQMPGMFSMLSLQKTIVLWVDYIKFNFLAKEIHEWTKLVRSVHGPFISCNDPIYHTFVYADGMERLKLFLLETRRSRPIFTRLTKERTKSL